MLDKRAKYRSKRKRSTRDPLGGNKTQVKSTHEKGFFPLSVL